MTPIQRIVFGAFLGAFIALIFFPKSNHLIAPYATKIFQEDIIANSSYNLKSPEGILPESKETKAFWIQRATLAMVERRKIDEPDLQRMVKWCTENGTEDVNNAFWPLVKSVFEWQLGAKDESRKSWILASNKEEYDDFQNWRIRKVADQVLAENGSVNAWHWSQIYDLRSNSATTVFGRHARTLQVAEIDNIDLELRWATLLNGVNLRRSSRSIEGGISGTRMCDLAAITTKNQSLISVRETAVARKNLQNLFLKSNEPSRADSTQTIYNENDSWLNVISSSTRYKNLKISRVESIWMSVIPASLLWTSLAFGALYLIGFAFSKIKFLEKTFLPIPSVILGLTFCVLIYYFLKLWLPSLVLALSFSFLAFRLPNVRNVSPGKMELTYKLPLIIFNIMMGICWFFFFANLGLPGEALRAIGDPSYTQFLGNYTLIGMILVITGLSFMVAPLWSLKSKIDPSILVHTIIRWLGLTGVITSLLMFIILQPMCIWLDGQKSESLRKIVLNEPNVYLTR